MVQRKKSPTSSRSAASRSSKKAPAPHARSNSSSMMSGRKSTKAGSRSH